VELNVRIPNTDGDVSIELPDEAEVIERPAATSGDIVWQAEIKATQGNMVPGGRQRTFTIRGPPRKTQAQAEADKKELDTHRPEGVKVVRALANKMHQG